jgi:lipopolysaccharide transport system permease protein
MPTPPSDVLKDHAAAGAPAPPASAYELRIRPDESWLWIDWRGLWEYRDLLFILVRRDFVSKFKQTILGPAWFIIQPLLTTVVFTVIFGNIAKLPTDGIPPMLFYLCGMLGWSYFANNFTGTSTTLVTNAQLFGKVYFPRLVVPLSTVLSNLFAFAIQLVLFLGFWGYFKFWTPFGAYLPLRWEVLLLPLIICQIGALSLGVGLWMSALTAKYRDFTHLSAFVVQLWMYGTPVIFPLSMIPPAWRWLVVLNPMTMPVESLKVIFLDQGSVDPLNLAISVVLCVLVLVSGLLLFQKIEQSFVDTV